MDLGPGHAFRFADPYIMLGTCYICRGSRPMARCHISISGTCLSSLLVRRSGSTLRASISTCPEPECRLLAGLKQSYEVNAHLITSTLSRHYKSHPSVAHSILSSSATLKPQLIMQVVAQITAEDTVHMPTLYASDPCGRRAGMFDDEYEVTGTRISGYGV